jgi:mono/diheme cytochrome c family protein
MKRVTSSYLGVLVVLCIALGTAGEVWAQESERPEMIPPGKVTTGMLEYRRHCAPCHGPNGKGDGPVAAVLTKKPADLTQITKGHAGKFPEDWVRRYIDGSEMIPAHGTSEMPIWVWNFPEALRGSQSVCSTRSIPGSGSSWITSNQSRRNNEACTYRKPHSKRNGDAVAFSGPSSTGSCRGCV